MRHGKAKHGIVTVSRNVADTGRLFGRLMPATEPKRGSPIRMVPMHPEVNRILKDTKITETRFGIVCPSKDFLKPAKIIDLPASISIPVPAVLKETNGRIPAIGFR